MKASTSYFVLSLVKGVFPLEVACDPYNLLCALLFLLYRAFSLFIAGGSSHLVSKQFRGLARWNLCHFFSFAVIPDVVIIAILLLLCICIVHSDQGITFIRLTVGSTWE